SGAPWRPAPRPLRAWESVFRERMSFRITTSEKRRQVLPAIDPPGPWRSPARSVEGGGTGVSRAGSGRRVASRFAPGGSILVAWFSPFEKEKAPAGRQGLLGASRRDSRSSGRRRLISLRRLEAVLWIQVTAELGVVRRRLGHDLIRRVEAALAHHAI